MSTAVEQDCFTRFIGKNANEAIKFHHSGTISLKWQNSKDIQSFLSLSASREILYYIFFHNWGPLSLPGTGHGARPAW